MKQEVTLHFARSTKRTHRYEEDGEGDQVIGTMYVQQSKLPNPPPQQLHVTITSEDGS